jgi:tRNA A-37 threonylcarbamoyl transferase component Bud32
LTGRTVVVKRADSEDERRALAQEVRLLEGAPPALPTLLDVEGPLGQPRAIALERVVGAPIRRCSVTPQVLADLLGALEWMHQRGFVHGDLKPAHLLVDERGRGRLLDLGLARPIGAPRRGGTLGYIAPEELAGAPTSIAGDLYAFGRSLHEILEASPTRPTTVPRETIPLVAACVRRPPATGRSRRSRASTRLERGDVGSTCAARSSCAATA